jgi:hypothetical protein
MRKIALAACTLTKEHYSGGNVGEGSHVKAGGEIRKIALAACTLTKEQYSSVYVGEDSDVEAGG